MSLQDNQLEPLPDDIKALLSDVAPGTAPSDVRERVLQRVQATVAAPEGDAAPNNPGEGAVAAGHGLGTAVAVLGVVMVVGALVLPGQGPPAAEVVPGVTLVESKDAPTARGVRPSATPMKAAPMRKVATSPLIAPPAEASPGGETAPLAPPTPPKAAQVVGKEEAKPVTPRGTVRSADKPAVRRVPARNLAAERRLLDKARSSLTANDGAGALQSVARHRELYPRGALVEERESLWVRALLTSGKRASGVKRAERFLRRFPRSIHRGAVERALGRARP